MEGMTAEECADILRATIRNRERMHKEEMVFIGTDGQQVGHGKINHDNDILYHAMKYALVCVEEMLGEKPGG